MSACDFSLGFCVFSDTLLLLVDILNQKFAYDLEGTILVCLVLQIRRHLRLTPRMPLSPLPHKMVHHLSACWGRIQTVTAMTANEKKMLGMDFDLSD